MFGYERKGHRVQVWRPVVSPGKKIEYVEVEGKRLGRQVSGYPVGSPYPSQRSGWTNVSRELPRRRAVRFAKAYRKAGFEARVVFWGVGGAGSMVVTDHYPAKRSAR